MLTIHHFQPPYLTTHAARARGHLHSQHRVAAPRHLTHPGRPAHARPPTERPCWTRSVAMRPWPSPSQSQPRDDSTGPICGARVRGGSRHTPRPRHGCVTLEPQLGWAPGRHCPRASATHHMPGNTREHASSTWQAQHRPCTRRRAANNLFGIPPPTAGAHASVRGPRLPPHPSYPLRPGAGLPWSGPTVEGRLGHACGEPVRIKPQTGGAPEHR